MMVSTENDPRWHGTIWMLNLAQETPAISSRVQVGFRQITSDLAPRLVQTMKTLPLKRAWRMLAMRRAWVIGLPGVLESIVADARRAFLNDHDGVWLNAILSSLKEHSK